MNFEQNFPGFLMACQRLHDGFMGVALGMLVLSFVFLYWQRPPGPAEVIKHLVWLFMVLLLISQSQNLANAAQEWVHEFVVANVPARPENVLKMYQDMLAAVEQDDKSWWDALSLTGIFDGIVVAVLYLVSYLAVACQYFVVVIQKVLLGLWWAMSPLMLSFLVVPPLSGIGMRFLLNLFGLVSWELGLGLAATITEGLLQSQVASRFSPGFGGGVSYVVLTLSSTAFIAIFILISTILAPAMMHRMIAGSPGTAAAFGRYGEMLANRWGSDAARAPLGMARVSYRSVQMAVRSAQWANQKYQKLQNFLAEPMAPASPKTPATRSDPNLDAAVKDALNPK